MISVLTLHDDVRRSINRINSDFDSSINSVDIDAYLNKSKDYLLENYSRLAERSKTFENMLKEIEVPDKSLKLVSSNNSEYITGILPDDYYDYLSVYAIAEKDNCRDTIWNNSYFQRDDSSLNDPNWEPSWEWRSGLYNISNLGIMFYHNSKYTVKEVRIAYIKSIPDVASPETVEGGVYKKADGTIITEAQDLIVTHPIFWRKMCALAVYYIRVDLDSNYKQSIDEIMFNEHTTISPNK